MVLGYVILIKCYVIPTKARRPKDRSYERQKKKQLFLALNPIVDMSSLSNVMLLLQRLEGIKIDLMKEKKSFLALKPVL